VRTTDDNGLWTELPKRARTAADVLEIEAAVYGGNDGAIAITDDLGLVNSKPYANAQTFTSLGGVAYPQSS
jgi:hypothetical protein